MTKTRICIRRLTKKDVLSYRRLRLEALRESPASFCSSYADEMKRPRAHFVTRLAAKENFNFGAFRKNVLIGILTILRETGTKQGHIGSLVGMYVAAECRRQKIGTTLLDHAIIQAKKLKSLRYLKLSVISGNDGARALYLSRGFKPFGIERDALFIDGRYLDEEYLALSLHPPRAKKFPAKSRRK